MSSRLNKPKSQIIQNRKQKKIVTLVEGQKNKKGLVFIAHGLGGYKEQAHLQTFTEAFLKAGYTVVRWDATNSVGQSDGELEEATLTNYYEDFEDVVGWSKNQPWYQEPFVVCGHSLGAACSIQYTLNHPRKIKALAPISTVVSGKLFAEFIGQKELADWKKRGYVIRPSRSRPGKFKKTSWRLMEDLLRYDFLKGAPKIKVPVLMVVGENDDRTPVEHQIQFYDRLGTDQKELHIIQNAPHTFYEKKELKEIKKIFQNWIEKI